MIDIHSHIINDIDDGSKSLEMSINMLKKAEQAGTTSIIATPTPTYTCTKSDPLKA